MNNRDASKEHYSPGTDENPIAKDEIPYSSPEQLERMKQYGLARNINEEHTDAYYRFQKYREEMLKKNPMTYEEINNIIHNGDR